MRVATNDGGSMEFVGTGMAFAHFRALSNELSMPRVIVCENDLDRVGAWSFSDDFRSNTNLSYFLNLDARSQRDSASQRFLSGDRLLAIDGRPISGIHRLTNGGRLSWRKDAGHGNGNILFEDGSVRSLDTRALRAALIRSGTATNRLSIPD